VIVVNKWKVAGFLFVFFAVVFLGFCLLILVGLSDNVVYPVDDMGTTSVSDTVNQYINPWFILFEFPFLVISAGAGLAIGSRTMSKGWKVVGGWTILALTLLGVCLYTTLSFLTYDWLYQLVPQNIAPWSPSGIDTHMFIQMAISNATVLSRYFWTAFGFVIAGVVAGLLGSHIGRRT
jgi:hypothetical protein